jgi:hypothetical protein
MTKTVRQQAIERLLQKVDERKEFVSDVDGFVYYLPEANNGHLSAWMLRAIAAQLDKRNAAWNAIIASDPAVGGGSTPRTLSSETLLDLVNEHRTALQGETADPEQAATVAQYIVLSFALDLSGHRLDDRVGVYLYNMARTAYQEAGKIGFQLAPEDDSLKAKE